MENEVTQVPAQRLPQEEDVTSSTEASPAILRELRTPFEQKVCVQFEGFNEFVEVMAANISETGMRIRTENPKPPGTVFDFECRLEDSLTLIEGRGEVVWVRTKTSTSGPHGMGIRFLELSENSRRYIQRLMDRHLQQKRHRQLVDKYRLLSKQGSQTCAEEEQHSPPEPNAALSTHSFRPRSSPMKRRRRTQRSRRSSDQPTEPICASDWTNPCVSRPNSRRSSK